MNRIEIREATPGGPLEVIGHAATVDEAYDVGGSFMETISRGAFRRSLSESPDVSLLVNHTGLPLARTTSGTLTLTEDQTGLGFVASLESEDPDVQAVVPKLRRGDITECSFAFRATRQEWNKDKTQRTVRECSIHRGDVSLVGMAANPGATATLRAEDLTLEQRERIAQRIGERVCGPRWGLAPGSADGWANIEQIARNLGERGRSQIAVPAPLPVRSYLPIAKARRAKARRGSRAPGERRRARTQAEVDKLGEAHLAWKKPDGTGYSFPIEDASDVKNALIAVSRARPAWRPPIRKFIMRRARALKCSDLIPPTWMASGALEGEPGPRPPAYA
jgi:HK97 family phage prohead protease